MQIAPEVSNQHTGEVNMTDNMKPAGQTVLTYDGFNWVNQYGEDMICSDPVSRLIPSGFFSEVGVDRTMTLSVYRYSSSVLSGKALFYVRRTSGNHVYLASAQLPLKGTMLWEYHNLYSDMADFFTSCGMEADSEQTWFCTIENGDTTKPKVRKDRFEVRMIFDVESSSAKCRSEVSGELFNRFHKSRFLVSDGGESAPTRFVKVIARGYDYEGGPRGL